MKYIQERLKWMAQTINELPLQEYVEQLPPEYTQERLLGEMFLGDQEDLKAAQLQFPVSVSGKPRIIPPRGGVGEGLRP